MAAGRCECLLFDGSPCMHDYFLWSRTIADSVNFVPYFNKKEKKFTSLPLSFFESIITRNRQLVWKRGLKWLNYALTLRAKLSQYPFFLTVHQNVNKSKSRAVRTAYGPIYSSFYVNVIFLFFYQDANKKESNCAIIGCNLSKKKKHCIKHRAEREATQIISFLNILLGATCTITWKQISKYYRAGQLVGAFILRNFKT